MVSADDMTGRSSCTSNLDVEDFSGGREDRADRLGLTFEHIARGSGSP